MQAVGYLPYRVHHPYCVIICSFPLRINQVTFVSQERVEIPNQHHHHQQHHLPKRPSGEIGLSLNVHTRPNCWPN